MNRPTELIARETMDGLIQQLGELTDPVNDNDERPWQQAEDKVLEMLAVVRTVQAAIIARRVKPAPMLHPLFAAICKPVSA